MRKVILTILLVAGVFLLTAGYLGAQTQKFPFAGEINSNNINVRCDATVMSKIICTVSEHQIIDVAAEVFGWYKIRLPRNSICYIKAKFVNIVPQAAGERESNTEKASISNFGVVNADAVNIRLEPNEASCILGRVNKDKAINIVSKEGDWYKITAPNTTYGWINKKFITPLQIPAQNTSAAGENIQPLTLEKPGEQGEITTQKTAEKDKDTVTVIGIVEPYGKIIGRKGTHKISTQDKKTYILKGDKKLLNSCSYRKVAIRGKLREIRGEEYPLILVEKVEVLN